MTEPSDGVAARRRGLPRIVVLLALPLVTMGLCWLVAPLALFVAMGLAVVGFVATILLWFRWRLSALAGIVATLVLLVVLALTPFVRVSLEQLEAFAAEAQAVDLAGLAGASPPPVGAPLRLEGASVRHDLTVEGQLHGATCELAPLVPEGLGGDDDLGEHVVTVWAVCCDDPRCERSLDATAQRIEAPEQALLTGALARARGEHGLRVARDPIFVELAVDRGARSVLAIAEKAMPLGLAVYIALVLIGWMLGAGDTKPARRAKPSA